MQFQTIDGKCPGGDVQQIGPTAWVYISGPCAGQAAFPINGKPA